MTTKTTEDEQRERLRSLERLRFKDTIAFLQSAGAQRDQELATYHQNLEAWAGNQQATTNQLVASQQALRSEVVATKEAVR